MTRVLCILLPPQLLSPKNQEPNGREPPSVPCLGCGPALFCFHYHTLLCNLHKYRVIFYRVAQKIERGGGGGIEVFVVYKRGPLPTHHD